jgi:hypothetical protein
MPPPEKPRRRGARRWLCAGALLAAAPKCVLCLLAYAGLGGAAAGLGAPEMCGEGGAAGGPALLGASTLSVALGAAIAVVRRRRPPV